MKKQKRRVSTWQRHDREHRALARRVIRAAMAALLAVRYSSRPGPGTYFLPCHFMAMRDALEESACYLAHHPMFFDREGIQLDAWLCSRLSLLVSETLQNLSGPQGAGCGAGDP